VSVNPAPALSDCVTTIGLTSVIARLPEAVTGPLNVIAVVPAAGVPSSVRFRTAVAPVTSIVP